jgi:hypothetical protein
MDDLSGEKRHNLLTKHFNALNAPQVLAFFRLYLQAAGVAPPAPSTPTPTVVTPTVVTPEPVVVPSFHAPTVVEPVVPLPAAPADPLATMVTPGTTVVSPTPPVTPTPVVTKAQFNKAVRDYTQGRIDEGEYTRIASAFQASIQQGHVT